MSGNDEEDAADLSSGLVANLLSLAKKKTLNHLTKTEYLPTRFYFQKTT